MNKYKYSFDLGAFFGSEEKETKLKAAPEVETSILPRPKQKQEAVQEAKPEYDPYGFIPDFAAAYKGAGGVPTVGSDLPLPAGEEQSRYALAVESLLNEMQGGLTPQPDLTAATPVDTPDMASSVEGAVAEAMGTSDPAPEVQPTEEATTATTEGGTTGGLMSPPPDTKKESFLDTGTFKLLEGVEGFKSKPYSLNESATLNGKPHKSGLTVGAGIDFGQHTKASLESIGIPKTMLDKAEKAGWIGLNPDTIIDPDTGLPAASRERGHALMLDRFKKQTADGTLPTFTKEELNVATPAMYKPYEDAAKKQLDAKFGEGTYDSLDEGSKAVLTLEKYHRGKTYSLPDAMLEGAISGNPLKAAEGISWSSRRKNMKDWIKKTGLIPNNAPSTSLRPKARPIETVVEEVKQELPPSISNQVEATGAKTNKDVNVAIFDATSFSGEIPTPNKGEDPIRWIAENTYGLNENDPVFRKAMQSLTNVDPKKTAWCAAFAGHVLRGVGVGLPERATQNPDLAFNYIDLGEDVYNHNPTTGKTYKGSLGDVRPGDVVVFNNGGRMKDGSFKYGKGHISFVVGTEKDGSIIAVGGNQGDGVKVTTTRYTPDIVKKHFKAGFTVRRVNDVTLEATDPAVIAAITKDISKGGAER